jgi:hypothetical protein
MRPLPAAILMAAGLALALVAGVLDVTFLMGAHPSSRGGRAGAAARLARHVRRSVAPDAVAGSAAGWRR